MGQDTPAPTGTPPLKPIICLTGIDGCGKSTHVRRLGAWLEVEHDRRWNTLSVWEIAKNARYHDHPFISDRAAVHRYLGLLHGGPRALFVFHGLLESLALTAEQETDLILANGYWYKYAFTEHLHGLNLDWLLQVAGCFPVPQLTILLDLPPEAAWARKPAVTPYECGFQTPSGENFIRFQRNLRHLFLAQADLADWQIVDADRPEEEVAAEISAIVTREVLTHGHRQL